jgi:hypothetical protein
VPPLLEVRIEAEPGLCPPEARNRELARLHLGARPPTRTLSYDAARSAAARRSSFSASAIRNAISRLCWALRRGSQ